MSKIVVKGKLVFLHPFLILLDEILK